jgi:hypothetical protein
MAPRACWLQLASLGAVAVAALGCASVRQLPAREPPLRARPPVALPAEPPPPGSGRVVLDCVDGPAEVSAVWAGALQEPTHHVLPARAQPFSGPVCTTPCIADLPYGRYDLYFSLRSPSITRGDHDQISVTTGVRVQRRALGTSTPADGGQRNGGVMLAIVGASAALTGAGFLALGASMDEQDSMVAIGGASLAGGALLTVIGALMMQAGQATSQEGATTSWIEQPSQSEATK